MYISKRKGKKEDLPTYSVKTSSWVTVRLDLKGRVQSISQFTTDQLLVNGDMGQTEGAETGDSKSRLEDYIEVVTRIISERKKDLNGCLSMVHLNGNGE